MTPVAVMSNQQQTQPGRVSSAHTGRGSLLQSSPQHHPHLLHRVLCISFTFIGKKGISMSSNSKTRIPGHFTHLTLVSAGWIFFPFGERDGATATNRSARKGLSYSAAPVLSPKT